MHNTDYTCGKCGRSVAKTTQVCPHCGAHLAGIKCQNCGFIGSERDFIADHCPKCHSAVHIPRYVPSGSYDIPSPGTNKAIGIIIIILAVSIFLIYSVGANVSTVHLLIQQQILFLFFIPIPAILLGVLMILHVKFWDVVGSFMFYSGIFFSISGLVHIPGTDPTESNVGSPLQCTLPLALAGVLILVVRYIRNHRK